MGQLLLITRHIFSHSEETNTLFAVTIHYNKAWPITRVKGEHKANHWIIRLVGGLDHDVGSDVLGRKRGKSHNYVLQQGVGSFG